MKILGIVGSNRKEGNSYLLLKEMFKNLPLMETKIIQVAELGIKPCELCFDECSRKPFECVIDDGLQTLWKEMNSADGIVIACPFYFYVPSRFQAVLERLSAVDYFCRKRHGKDQSPLRGKPCLLVTVSGSGSNFNAFQMLHHLQEFALTLLMRPVTTPFWPYNGFCAKSGEIEKGAILKESKTIGQAKEVLSLLVAQTGLTQ